MRIYFGFRCSCTGHYWVGYAVQHGGLSSRQPRRSIQLPEETERLVGRRFYLLHSIRIGRLPLAPAVLVHTFPCCVVVISSLFYASNRDARQRFLALDTRGINNISSIRVGEARFDYFYCVVVLKI